MRTISFTEIGLCLLAVHWRLSSAADLPACTKVTSCTCARDDGQGITISNLGVPGFPKFQYHADPMGKFLYTYNPCYNFKDEYCTKEVIACQTNIELTNSNSLGTADEAEWSQDDGYYSIHYTGGDEGRSTIVQLHCDESATEPTLQVLGELQTKAYYFRLTTVNACLPAYTGGGLSPGSILCIIFSVLVVVYVIGGVLFMKFVRGADGGKELVPNSSFWLNLPGYIKDGVMFIIHCGKTSSSYQNVD